MEWEKSSNGIQARSSEQKAEVCVPSTEGMPPLSDITKHKGKRRTRTGSLTADINSVLKMPPLTRIRRPPITGGSWDDNSVGHGSVVSRFRRERNRAIMRTQSSATNPLSYHSIDTHANVTQTLNLINTTSLSPMLSDRLHDNAPWLSDFWPSEPSAAAKTSAGSMCNITTSGYPSKQPWDTLSIPELHSTKSCDRMCRRSHHRHSYSSGHANASFLHSSPTSGCASIASSDLDSADFMYFNINDDSSYFDGDSLFADSTFSTNILSLLEEGSISCRTPFPASDWSDSISELDFDCSEGKSQDVKNCDALSDIGPSCSSPPQRRRMAKRQNKNVNKWSERPNNESESVAATQTFDRVGGSLLSHPISESTWSSLSSDEKQEYLNKLWTTISQSLSSEDQLDVLELLYPSPATRRANATKDVEFVALQRSLKYLRQRTSGERSSATQLPTNRVNVLKSIMTFDNVTDVDNAKPSGFELTKTQRNSRKSSEEGLPRKRTPDRCRSRPSSRHDGVLSTGESRHAESCSESSCVGCCNELRRSNSEGNIPGSVGALKEQRKQNRQARRWTKWTKTRQRKESRQLQKEHRSGLFLNERKMKLTRDGYEEEVEVG